ncbi:hypothetical protein BBF93_17685 [Hyphomonas sp. CACIAM 19H1]|nr:hypothetical protein BBF93_17685 [Hyphomonas sp. CACIAM 19H1]
MPSGTIQTLETLLPLFQRKGEEKIYIEKIHYGAERFSNKDWEQEISDHIYHNDIYVPKCHLLPQKRRL